jgi:uncharacterized protein (TIGR02246 family)
MFGLAISVTAQDRKQDDKAIRDIVAHMENGWNASNGKVFSTGFAPRHDYVVWSGIYLPNLTQDSNAMAHQQLFNNVYPHTDVELKVDKIRYLRDDIATAIILGATYDEGTPVPPQPKVIITLVLEKTNAEWQIVSFHNCDIEILEPGAPPAGGPPPHIMFASWNRSEP